MDSLIKPINSKRFVIEDSITKVTSDGEPHGVMTVIAGVSGLIAAIAILAILVLLLGYKKNKRTPPCQNCIPTTYTAGIRNSPCIKHMNNKYTSNANNNLNPTWRVPPSIAVISKGNLKANLNAAFENNELQSHDLKTKKKITLSDKVTTIDIERY